MNRLNMAEVLEEHLRKVNVYFDREGEFPKGHGPLKTYLLEAHGFGGDDLNHATVPDALSKVADASNLRFQETEDKTLFQLTDGDVGFFFDVLDPRFWIVHTMSNVDKCEQVLDRLVDLYPNLDFAWPPSELMRQLQKNGKPAGFATTAERAERDAHQDQVRAVMHRIEKGEFRIARHKLTGQVHLVDVPSDLAYIILQGRGGSRCIASWEDVQQYNFE